MRRRCIFCHKPVDKNGYCQNTSCIDYLRTQICEAEDAKKAAEAAAKEAAEKENSSADTTSETTNTDTTTNA